MARYATGLVLASLCVHGAVANTLVRVRGSSTFLPFVQSVAEDYMAQHANVNVVVAGGGSSRGYKALLDDTADVAIASGPMSPALKREVERRGLRLRLTTIGYRALVAAVHPGQPLHDVTLPQLRAFFTGKTAYWPVADDRPAQPVQVLVGPPTGGLTLVWRDLVLEDDDTFTPKAVVVAQERRAHMLASMPRGITFLALGAGDPGKTRALSINGVTPTEVNVLNGTYPLRAELVLVTREKRSAAVTAFLDAFSSPRPDWRLDGLILAPAKTAAAKP